MPLDRCSDKMIAERKGRTTNRGKGAIEMALQRIASVAKILWKGAIVMLCGRSQRNENLQGDECILQQISALRRENRFLKVGLIFCLVLSSLPYLTGFQPTVIRASKVVTERVEFVRDGKTVTSLVVHPKKIGMVIEDGKANGLVFLGGLSGGMVGVYNEDGGIVASIMNSPLGGSVNVLNKDGKIVANMYSNENGGSLDVNNKDETIVASMFSTEYGGAIGVHDKNGKIVASINNSPIGSSINVHNQDGNIVASMIGLPTGGMMGIRDKSGKLVWSAP